LISKFDVVDVVAWLPQLLAEYAAVRGWQNTPGLDKMHRLVASHRLVMAKKYADEKVFRRCSDVHIEKVHGDFVAIARPFLSTGLVQALQKPDALLNADTAQRIKSGNTCTVSLAQVDARKVVVKRYNIKSIGHGLSRAFRQTRAAASWANAHRLMILGIATAAPVALYEKRIGIIRRQSYFLAEYVDAPDVAQFFADTDITLAQKEIAAASIARLFYQLKLLMISHGDFKASNIKMVENRPVLIDLDSLRQHRCLWFFEQGHVRDLKRFLRNWPQCSATQQLLLAAFSQVYEDTSLLEQAGMMIK
ncbi:MAG: lipopolysaccharide kinase InaA family protein, partial [Candidatus Methylopumilus sp.]